MRAGAPPGTGRRRARSGDQLQQLAPPRRRGSSTTSAPDGPAGDGRAQRAAASTNEIARGGARSQSRRRPGPRLPTDVPRDRGREGHVPPHTRGWKHGRRPRREAIQPTEKAESASGPPGRRPTPGRSPPAAPRRGGRAGRRAGRPVPDLGHAARAPGGGHPGGHQAREGSSGPGAAPAPAGVVEEDAKASRSRVLGAVDDSSENSSTGA